MRYKFDFKIAVGDNDVAYLYLIKKKLRTKAKKTVDIRDFISEYKGPDVFFDFSEEGELIGIEFLL